ncbi:MAG TPA: hypothetical protein VJ654_20370 [Noviherbaspirillum sp.]|nr:hypothetical protein [Noviherbaspirillum sp.]
MNRTLEELAEHLYGKPVPPAAPKAPTDQQPARPRTEYELAEAMYGPNGTSLRVGKAIKGK